jgi:hypothetical protein
MDVRGFVGANARAFIEGLKQWLAIPSISADPGRPTAEINGMWGGHETSAYRWEELAAADLR